jgi:hypothetical protein
VQQLRIFGSSGEILVWRSGERRDGRYAARLLADERSERTADEGSMDEVFLVLGDQVIGHGRVAKVDYTALRDRGGRVHVPPWHVESSTGLQYSLGLDVRHYLEREQSSGAMRVACGRLLGLRALSEHEARVRA